MMRDAKASDIHLEADIKATDKNSNGFADGTWIPYLAISLRARASWDHGRDVDGPMMPMVASDGPHYGDNVKLAGPGKYRLTLTVAPPGSDPHTPLRPPHRQGNRRRPVVQALHRRLRVHVRRRRQEGRLLTCRTEAHDSGWRVAALAMLALSRLRTRRTSWRFELVAKDGRFEPPNLEVPAGKRIKIEVSNEGTTPIEFESQPLKHREGAGPGREVVGGDQSAEARRVSVLRRVPPRHVARQDRRQVSVATRTWATRSSSSGGSRRRRCSWSASCTRGSPASRIARSGIRYLWGGVAAGFGLAVLLALAVLGVARLAVRRGARIFPDGDDVRRVGAHRADGVLDAPPRSHPQEGPRGAHAARRPTRANWWGMLVVVALAVGRETAETVVFLYGVGLAADGARRSSCSSSRSASPRPSPRSGSCSRAGARCRGARSSA